MYDKSKCSSMSALDDGVVYMQVTSNLVDVIIVAIVLNVVICRELS